MYMFPCYGCRGVVTGPRLEVELPTIISVNEGRWMLADEELRPKSVLRLVYLVGTTTMRGVRAALKVSLLGGDPRSVVDLGYSSCFLFFFFVYLIVRPMSTLFVRSVDKGLGQARFYSVEPHPPLGHDT